MIYEKLEDVFKNSFSDSNKVCIAIGLISEGKAKEIGRLARKYNADIYLIVGIDMPTPNSALQALMKAESNNKNLKVRYYSEDNFFHPKVFLFKKRNKMVAYVGSANYTERGFSSNSELTLQTEDGVDCNRVKKWFNDLWKNASSPITKEMIACRMSETKKYKWSPLPKMSRVKKVSKHINDFNQDEFIKELRSLKRNETIYKKIRRIRNKTIKDLSSCLDAEHGFEGFKGEKIDEFCNEGSLGDLKQHGVRKALHTASRNGTLRPFCIALADESQPIKNRVSKALKELNSVGKGTITKILTTLYPKKYILINGCSTKYLSLTGLSSGKRYVEYCEFGKELLRQLNVENFAVLDGLIRQASEGDAV
jgi:hypothetical protein